MKSGGVLIIFGLFLIIVVSGVVSASGEDFQIFSSRNYSNISVIYNEANVGNNEIDFQGNAIIMQN